MNAPRPLSISVSTTVAAPPEVVYDLVADLPSMPRYSPETVGVRWLDGMTGPTVGARFCGRNRIRWARWSTRPTVTAVDRGARFAFQVPGPGGPLWTYRFEAADGGTIVTESMHQTEPSPWPVRLVQRWAGVTDREAHLRNGMRHTLAQLAAAVSPAAAPPRPRSTGMTQTEIRREEAPMDYLILIHSDETAAQPAPGTAAFDTYMAGWMAFNQRLIDGGHWISAANLQPTITATTLRRGTHGTTLVDGPYLETKEQLGGFYLIRAADLDEALELAAAVPLPAGSLEVRPVAFRPAAG